MSGINRQAEPRRTAKSTRITEEGNWFALFAENFMHEISGVPGAELFSAGWLDGNRRYAD
jgi:hypothetical protein